MALTNRVVFLGQASSRCVLLTDSSLFKKVVFGGYVYYFDCSDSSQVSAYVQRHPTGYIKNV